MRTAMLVRTQLKALVRQRAKESHEKLPLLSAGCSLLGFLTVPTLSVYIAKR